jgi:hypothetical protein
MPIEFAPPAPNLQGFNVQPPAYTDPLQTLAQMGQLRTQGLQQQSAGMQLEQERQKLDSSKALLDAMVKGGGDIDKTFAIAAGSGKVLPADLIAMREHHVKMQQDAASLDKTTRENTATDLDRYRSLILGAQNQEDLDTANARADQLGVGKAIPRHTQFSDPSHLQAFANSLVSQAQVLKEAQEKAAREREEAQAKLAGVQTTEAEQKVATGERQAAIQEIQAAADPTTGVPSPADWVAIQQRHPKVQLPPGRPTPDIIAAYVRSAVAPEKQPEFDLNAMKAKMGLLGNTEFDQFMLKHAQGLNTTPAKLTPEQFNQGLQKYATLKQDPTLLALLIGQKGLQGQVLQAQVNSIPGPDDIKMLARQMVNGDMSPDDMKQFRSRYGNAATQIIREAEEMVKAEGNPLFPGKPFSIANLQAALETRALTEKKFADGPQADMIRSFDNLMQHAALGDEARKALVKSDFPAIRKVANALGVQVGDDAATTYDLIADFISKEAGKAFQPAGGGEAERAQTYAHFERGLGDTQLRKNYAALMHLADAQRQGLENQYARGTFGKGLQTGKLFSQEALDARDRLMGRAPAAAQRPPGVPANAVEVPLKSGRSAWLTPDAAVKFKAEHPELVK